MTIYVDNSYLPASVPSGGRKVTSRWCHLWTDSDDQTELHELAGKIGLRRSWFQGGKSLPHYDVTLARRAAAVLAGAVEVDWREAARMSRRRRLAERATQQTPPAP